MFETAEKNIKRNNLSDRVKSYKMDILNEYPVILSTTFSSRDSLNDNVVYDYVIMDESSQVDIATGALAMSCAKNMVIVGDTNQLPNVVDKHTEIRADVIFNQYNLSKGYRFTNSFLQSVLEVTPNVTQTMLREHYRCHPKIIEFCNQKFYRGNLIIMTEDHGEKDVLKVIKTVKGNHSRNHFSQRQIDIIKNEIIPNDITNKKETGIISPYNNQVQSLKEQIDGIEQATVHKFQGKEKETEPDFVLTYAENQAEDYPTTLGAKYFAELVEERTNGRIRILVQPVGVLGSENKVIKQMQYGGIDFARVSLAQLAEYIPSLNVLQMPYLYTDSDHMWRVLDGEIGDAFLESVSADDVIGLSWYDAGARNFYNSVT